MKSYLKVALFILVAYAAAGCLQTMQPISSHPPEPTPTAPSLGETPVHAGGYAEGQPGLEQTLPAGQAGIQVSKEPSTRVEQSEGKKPKNAQQVLDEALEFCKASQDFWGQGDFENAVDSLDQAYNLILSADKNDDPKLIQQKEDIRFMICKRMLEIYTSRYTVATGNHDAIPMVMNR